jgi:hypothetical protein
MFRPCQAERKSQPEAGRTPSPSQTIRRSLPTPFRQRLKGGHPLNQIDG